MNYFKNLLILVIFICTSFGKISAQNIGAEHSAPMQAVCELARSYRQATDALTEEEIVRQQAILDQMNEQLPRYRELEELSTTIFHFLQDELGEKGQNYTLVNAAETEIRGKSKDVVFFVMDRAGSLQFVVKAFRTPLMRASKLLPEISALDFLRQRAIPGTVQIEPLAAALCDLKDQSYGLLLETAAPGKRVDQFLKDIGKFAPGSEEREESLQIALHVIQRVGESLALLHDSQNDQLKPLPKLFLEKLEKKYLEVMHSPVIVAALTNHLAMDAFQAYILDLIQTAREVKVFASYQHGDANLGNMLYDKETNVLTFIDVAKLHSSMTANGTPLSEGTQEVVRTEESLRKNAINLLSEEEVAALTVQLKQAYEEASQMNLDDKVVEIATTYRKLGRLISYVNADEQVDPELRAKNRALFEQSVEYFIRKVRSRYLTTPYLG